MQIRTHTRNGETTRVNMTDREIARLADALEDRLPQRLTPQIAEAVEKKLAPRFERLEEGQKRHERLLKRMANNQIGLVDRIERLEQDEGWKA